LNALDLFSGIGGNTLALKDYVKTIAYCEADRHAQAVLLSRMADGSIEPAPIWDDVSSLRAECFDVPIDIIIAGFPCQDISSVGSRSGLAGKRSGLFFEVLRLIDEIKPPFAFLENVPAIRTRGGERVVKELARRGYDCRWDTISAYDVGAPHKRERWFLMAYSKSKRDLREVRDIPHQDAEKDRPKIQYEKKSRLSLDASRWETEPAMGRMVNGIPYQLDRLKRLGNAVVPVQAKEAFERLIGLK